MKQSDWANLFTKLRYAYPYYFKDMSKEEMLACVSVYKKYLEEFNYMTLENAIDYLVTNTQYMPSIAEIYEYCKKNFKYKKDETIEKMIRSGYFLTDEEIDKAYKYIETGKIPQWFLEDYKKYNTKMIGE